MMMFSARNRVEPEIAAGCFALYIGVENLHRSLVDLKIASFEH